MVRFIINFFAVLLCSVSLIMITCTGDDDDTPEPTPTPELVSISGTVYDAVYNIRSGVAIYCEGQSTTSNSAGNYL